MPVPRHIFEFDWPSHVCFFTSSLTRLSCDNSGNSFLQYASTLCCPRVSRSASNEQFTRALYHAARSSDLLSDIESTWYNRLKYSVCVLLVHAYRIRTHPVSGPTPYLAESVHGLATRAAVAASDGMLMSLSTLLRRLPVPCPLGTSY